MKNIVLLMFLFILTGCLPKPQTMLLPVNYIKLGTTDEANIYLVKPANIHYQGRKGLLQIEMVISLKKEDVVAGKKFKSTRARYVYDCNNLNKYTEIPFGFYSDLYATGEPVVPYPLNVTQWKIAKDGTIDSFFWENLCNKEYLNKN